MTTGVFCCFAGGRVHWTSFASFSETGSCTQSCQDTGTHSSQGECVQCVLYVVEVVEVGVVC